MLCFRTVLTHDSIAICKYLCVHTIKLVFDFHTTIFIKGTTRLDIKKKKHIITNEIQIYRH